MSLNKLTTAAFLTFSVLAVLSCKKDEDETYPSLGGSIKIEGLELFMDASTTESRTIRVKPSGAIHPEGKEVGYSWKVSPVMKEYKTTRLENGLDENGNPSDGSFEYQIKDSLGTYTVYCSAFAEGYSSIQGTAYTTLVKTGKDGSITDSGIYDNSRELEGTPYRYVTVGGLDWINSNIYEDGRGVAYRNADPMAGVFGRYYSHDEAVAACKGLPGGNWRLPTESDWVKTARSLVKDNPDAPQIKEFSNILWDKETNGTPTIASLLMADASFNGTKMWDYWPAVGEISNGSGLAFLPVGYSNLGVTPAAKSTVSYPDASFEGLYEYSAFWTGSEVENDGNKAYYRYIIATQPHLMIGKAYKISFGASVRCVRDAR